MRARSPFVVMVGLLAVAGCGRTGFDLPEEEFGDGALDGDEPGVGFDDGTEPEPEPLPDPPLPESCGNGIAEPGELCFMPQITFWSRIDPCALDIGDFDGDGHLDVVTPNSDFDHIESLDNLTSVLYGNGLGQLGEPIPYITGDDIPVGVRAGDFDGDESLDAVVVNSDAGTMSMLLNAGERKLLDAGRLPVGESPVIPDVADLDGDGNLDVVVTATDQVSVAYGRGDGTFARQVDIVQPGWLWAPHLVDIDEDGAPDLLVSNASDQVVHVWMNDGEGRLGAAYSLAMPGPPTGISHADVDADGHVDVLVAHMLGMAVLLGNGQGDLSSFAQVSAGIEPRDIAIADYDNDGVLDAAIVNSGSENVTLTVGVGNGDFEIGATYSVGVLPSGIEAGDFNSDGVPDLAVSNQLSNNIGLILSNP